MKNITVSVDDETYRLARVKAAERGTSVSAMVREYLNSVPFGYRVWGYVGVRYLSYVDERSDERR